jgi:hypothetical protein
LFDAAYKHPITGTIECLHTDYTERDARALNHFMCVAHEAERPAAMREDDVVLNVPACDCCRIHCPALRSHVAQRFQRALDRRADWKSRVERHCAEAASANFSKRKDEGSGSCSVFSGSRRSIIDVSAR